MRVTQLTGTIRWVAGLAGLVLFSFSASAQSKFLSAASAASARQPALSAVIPTEPSFVPVALGVWALPARGVTLESPATVKAHFVLTQRASLHAVPGFAGEQSMADRMAGAFEEIKTPFLHQVRVQLISIGGGRVQLSGFQRVTPMVNVLWGLPLRASTSEGSAVQQVHPGIRVPGNNESYGLSLSVRFSKQDADRAGNGLWSGVRKAASWGRAFFSI